jgi:hypothetical protein
MQMQKLGLYQEKRKAMMWMELTGLFDEKLRR